MSCRVFLKLNTQPLVYISTLKRDREDNGGLPFDLISHVYIHRDTSEPDPLSRCLCVL